MQKSSKAEEFTYPAVCFVNTTREWGGGEKWHYDMALLLKDSGYPVFSVTARKSALQKQLLEAGIPNTGINIGNLSFLNSFIRLKLHKFFKKNAISVVIMNLPSDLKTAGPAAKKADVSKVIYRRGSAIPVKNSLLNRHLYRNVVDLVLVNSNATRRTILKKNPHLIPKEKIKVLYNGLILEDYKCDDRHRNTSDKIIIGNLGRFVKQKGQHRFIEIAEKLKQKDISFKIILGGKGNLKKDIQKKIKERGLENYFELPGFIEDTARFMQGIDVFVLTSYWEGFGYVLAEAMACCKPVIGFNVSSNPELIREGQNGFLIEDGDLESLAEKIEYFYKNPSEIPAMGEQGRRMVEEEFEINKVRDKLIQIIEQ